LHADVTSDGKSFTLEKTEDAIAASYAGITGVRLEIKTGD
jgi:hypothetical protein